MDLDLRKVRYFVAVAERLHFGRAAEDLLIAQPALSRQIRALERELGAELFVRDSHRVHLTAAGERLLGDARPLLAAAAAARRRAGRAAHAAGRLVVGFRSGIRVTGAIRGFGAAHPDVAVEVRRVDWDDQAAAVLDGRVDVAYVRLPVVEPGLDLTPLYGEPRMAALPAGHPLAARTELTAAQCAAQTEILHLCTNTGASGPRQPPAVRTVEEKLEYVAAGRGLTYLPRSTALLHRRPDVVYRPVTDLPPDEVALARPAGEAGRLAAAFTAAALRAAAEEHPGRDAPLSRS
ncbi:LysR family transcriptional regulator [Streptomyces sp. NPDC020983]|uniref:LysR family transcriptional regulator n=1 Tax=Streptomyces sp. NPDC020983 TaxID=3365106 RepID=UPI0037B72B8D